MNIFSFWRKRSAIIKYRTKLGRDLARDYGASNSYLPAQIEATVVRAKLSKTYAVYAVGMYSEPEEYEAYVKAQGLKMDYETANVVVTRILSGRTFGYNHTDLTVSREGTHGQGGIGGGE